jgi:hypothetical protein
MNEIIKVRSEYPPTVPLSHLELELDRPVEGWPTFLGVRGVKIIGDDLGRDSVARHDARRLLDERREQQVRQAALARLAEQEAVEADERRRALIWRGLPADAMPSGASPASVMLEAAKGPRRQSMVEAAFANDGTVMHTFSGEAEDW